MPSKLINFIVKIDMDTWFIMGHHTNPELTKGVIFETEYDAIHFMQAQNLPYTTGITVRKGKSAVIRDVCYHATASYATNPFMKAFAELF